MTNDMDNALSDAATYLLDILKEVAKFKRLITYREDASILQQKWIGLIEALTDARNKMQALFKEIITKEASKDTERYRKTMGHMNDCEQEIERLMDDISLGLPYEEYKKRFSELEDAIIATSPYSDLPEVGKVFDKVFSKKS